MIQQKKSKDTVKKRVTAASEEFENSRADLFISFFAPQKRQNRHLSSQPLDAAAFQLIFVALRFFFKYCNSHSRHENKQRFRSDYPELLLV